MIQSPLPVDDPKPDTTAISKAAAVAKPAVPDAKLERKKKPPKRGDGTTGEVACVLCGYKADFLGPHVKSVHDMMPKEYAKHHGPLWGPTKQAIFEAGTPQDPDINRHASMMLRILHATTAEGRRRAVSAAADTLTAEEAQAAGIDRLEIRAKGREYPKPARTSRTT